MADDAGQRDETLEIILLSAAKAAAQEAEHIVRDRESAALLEHYSRSTLMLVRAYNELTNPSPAAPADDEG